MKRLKFKNPLKGLDNAKKLIPEAYKMDGKEFEMTDGNETYRLKWESDLNEATVLTSNNKSQINEDMNKIKHLMGFKSQDTLGTVKGAARLDENNKFNDILGKSKSLIKEMTGGMGFTGEGNLEGGNVEITNEYLLDNGYNINDMLDFEHTYNSKRYQKPEGIQIDLLDDEGTGSIVKSYLFTDAEYKNDDKSVVYDYDSNSYIKRDITNPTLAEEANEDLELKSLAKQFIPIIKKYKMGVEYKTDTKSIEAKPDNINQTPPAKLIVHNDGILTVAVYFLSLSRSLNELDYEGGPSEQDYEKAKSQAGNMYKELIAVVPEGEFDSRSRPEPNKYGWYMMQFKKKQGSKDLTEDENYDNDENKIAKVLFKGLADEATYESNDDETTILSGFDSREAVEARAKVLGIGTEQVEEWGIRLWASGSELIDIYRRLKKNSGVNEGDNVEKYLDKKDGISSLNNLEDKLKSKDSKIEASKETVRDLTADNDGEENVQLVKKVGRELINTKDGEEEEEKIVDTSMTNEGTKDRFDEIFEGYDPE